MRILLQSVVSPEEIARANSQSQVKQHNTFTTRRDCTRRVGCVTGTSPHETHGSIRTAVKVQSSTMLNVLATGTR